MNGNRYDVIVVGARCAGSPTAMLLARKGYRVLVVDRATFPSDTVSTHLIHPPGVAALRALGPARPVDATGCPPIDTYPFDFGPFTIAGTPGTGDGPGRLRPRRTVLDKMLVDAAADAGAEVREGFTVEEIVVEDGAVIGIRGHGQGGATVTERARVVVGADGRHSLSPRPCGRSSTTRSRRCCAATTRTGAASRWTAASRPTSAPTAAGPLPTNDGLTLVVVGWPYAEFDSQQDRRRRQLPARRSSWRPSSPSASRRRTREERFLGTRGAELLPQAVRSGLGARRRRRLQQGLHHRPGHHRRLPRRRALRRPRSTRRSPARAVRRRDGRLPAGARHPVLPMYEFTPARDAGAAAAADAAAPRRHPRQPGRHGRLRQRQRRHDLARRVLRRAERRPDHGTPRTLMAPYRNGGRPVRDPEFAGLGGAGHRRRLRHRPGHRPAAGRPGRQGGLPRPGRRPPSRPRWSRSAPTSATTPRSGRRSGEAAQRLGGLDIVVNNAGVGAVGTIEANPDSRVAPGVRRQRARHRPGDPRRPALCCGPRTTRWWSTPARSRPASACPTGPCTAPPRAPCRR